MRQPLAAPSSHKARHDSGGYCFCPRSALLFTVVSSPSGYAPWTGENMTSADYFDVSMMPALSPMMKMDYKNVQLG